MLGDDDLALGVFTPAEVATSFRRIRAAAADVEVAGILGVQDANALQGQVIAAQRRLCLPGLPDVRADDVLEVLTPVPGLGLSIGARLRVLDVPERTGDGRQLEALLGSVSP
jgi:hypothetical protein